MVVPPALPATLSIGTSFALSRLRRSGIFCISPNRINVAGKINVCCFDKTGTLTEDGLDILGVRAVERRSGTRFGELLDNVYDLPGPVGREKATFLYALATCHQLKVVDGEVIGDPLDVKMFQFTKWLIEEGNIAGTGVIRGRRSGEAEARPAALVQTIVRPPGSAQFKIEDALKSGTKVCLLSLRFRRVCTPFLGKVNAGRLSIVLACPLPRVWCHPHVRVRLATSSDERHRQASPKHDHGDIREGRS